jgi:excisionase family DNA binding protein
MPDFLSRQDAAEYLRCSVRKIDRLKQSGRLVYTKLDGTTLFRKEALQSLLSAPPDWTPAKVVTRDANELPASAIRSTGRRAA